MSKHLLQQAISFTPHTEQQQVKQLLKTLTDNALNGTIVWDRNLMVTLNQAIRKIDQTISKQLATILHAEPFQQLESRWRGLHYLIKNSPCNQTLKIKVMHLTKSDLQRDMEKAIEFDQSQLFKKIYEAEFGSPGGEPYGVLIGDYYFNHQPTDVQMLSQIASIAANAFCPFISAADPSLMGLSSWTELSKPRDLEKIFSSSEYTQWQSFRELEQSRFVALTLPKTLARLPYGESTHAIDAFRFEEIETGQPLAHQQYCWMNAAYALGQRLCHAFSELGWCTAIRGSQGGGKVSNLPLHHFVGDDGDIDTQCPTEIGITDRREAELSRLGLLPLCHYKNSDYAVFFGADTVQKAKRYDTSEANANAAISTRLPFIMATSRFSHYVKMMARDKIGAFMQAEEVEQWLNRWILNYVNSNPQSKQQLKAKYPLAEAKIAVQELADKPGHYQAIAWLKPWLQMEELSASMRLVAQIPTLQ